MVVRHELRHAVHQRELLVVTNTVGFSAFVDIGVHQDGLVHVSQLADRFIRDPNDVVKVGQKVRASVVLVGMR